MTKKRKTIDIIVLFYEDFEKMSTCIDIHTLNMRKLDKVLILFACCSDKFHPLHFSLSETKNNNMMPEITILILYVCSFFSSLLPLVIFFSDCIQISFVIFSFAVQNKD